MRRASKTIPLEPNLPPQKPVAGYKIECGSMGAVWAEG